MLGMIHNGFEDSTKYYLITDSLLCNIWHVYNIWTRGPGWIFCDQLNAVFSEYGKFIDNVIKGNREHNMRTIFMREKLLYLCFGQRSDYQCEETGFNPDLLPYTYRIHPTGQDTTDNTIYGNGARVRYCSTTLHDSGYVCKGLRANREQVNKHSNWGAYAVDSIYKWYVKPRIRIDSTFANNPANYEKLVCRIEVFNFPGDKILNTNLRVRNFKLEAGNTYNGNYIDTFYFKNGDSTLIIDTFKKFNPSQEVHWNDAGKVDFRVFWYKQCDMWIDYVRVDNETADKLFKGYYQDPTSQKPWLLWEIDSLALPNSDNLDRIYIEEFEFNQIPCMKYISDYAKSKNSNFSLMFDLNIPTYSAHKEDHENYYDLDHIKRNLYDVIQPKEVFSFSYPLKARYVDQNNKEQGNYYIPNTLPGPDLSFNPMFGRLAIPASPSFYDTQLQDLLDYDGTMSNRNILKTLDALSKKTNLPIIFMPQGHLVYWQYHQLKEPTNEELSLLTYLSLTYGAKGILHYHYGGGGCFTRIANDAQGIGYERGFGNPQPANCNLFGDPRYINSYGQRKWTNLKEINNHIIKWSNYLLKFDIKTRNSYAFRISEERNDLLNTQYFKDILTYKPSVGTTPCQDINPDSSEIRASITPECRNDRYLQTGFFTINYEPYNRYFMMVNRRCSPYLDENSQNNNGGRRLIKIRFNVTNNSLPGFNNFKITDLYNDSTIITFDKRSNQYIDLGWYKPGEAKLYKITPVMQ